MIKAPKNREEYLVRCLDLQSIKPSSEYWARRVQIADVYIYSLEDKIRELIEKAERMENSNSELKIMVNTQQNRIKELETQSHSEALIRSELEEQIDFFTRSLHCTPANTYEALTGRIKELEARLAEKEKNNGA